MHRLGHQADAQQDEGLCREIAYAVCVDDEAEKGHHRRQDEADHPFLQQTPEQEPAMQRK